MKKTTTVCCILVIACMLTGCFKYIDVKKYRGEKLIPYRLPQLKTDKRVIIFPYKNADHAHGLLFDTSDIDELRLDSCVPNLFTNESGHPDEYWVRFHFDIPNDIESIERIQLVLFAHSFGLKKGGNDYNLIYEISESNSKLKSLLEKKTLKTQMKLEKAVEDTDYEFFMVYELNPQEVLNIVKKESYGKLHLAFSFSSYARSKGRQFNARKWNIPASSVDFASNQHPLEAIRPKLIIDYESKSTQKIVLNNGSIALIPFLDKANLNNQKNVIGEMIVDLLNDNLRNNNSNLNFVDRASIKEIFNELSLTLTGLVKEDEMKKVGKILSANYLMLGEYEIADNSIKVNCRLVETETTKIIFAFSETRSVEDLETITKNICDSFMKKITVSN